MKTNHNPTRFKFVARLSRRRNPNDREGRSREIREWLRVAIAIAKFIFDLWPKH